MRLYAYSGMRCFESQRAIILCSIHITDYNDRHDVLCLVRFSRLQIPILSVSALPIKAGCFFRHASVCRTERVSPLL
ncbi:hypothetical protein L596_003732 [Steinernema carpocapsae]|uniref:Uncharacterized protein n=1 Tax=Steinernema carpocapsae TaxID=34508 RepID=A0A4V6I850_STECR|nr:hypothetical protein L596_003732 [Steinernema carpocapsae]